MQDTGVYALCFVHISRSRVLPKGIIYEPHYYRIIVPIQAWGTVYCVDQYIAIYCSLKRILQLIYCLARERLQYIGNIWFPKPVPIYFYFLAWSGMGSNSIILLGRIYTYTYTCIHIYTTYICILLSYILMK